MGVRGSPSQQTTATSRTHPQPPTRTSAPYLGRPSIHDTSGRYFAWRAPGKICAQLGEDDPASVAYISPQEGIQDPMELDTSALDVAQSPEVGQDAEGIGYRGDEISRSGRSRSEPRPGLKFFVRTLYDPRANEGTSHFRRHTYQSIYSNAHFKMEGLPALRDLIQPGDYLCKLDIKDAYVGVPIHPASRKFLSFEHHGQVLRY